MDSPPFGKYRAGNGSECSFRSGGQRRRESTTPSREMMEKSAWTKRVSEHRKLLEFELLEARVKIHTHTQDPVWCTAPEQNQQVPQQLQEVKKNKQSSKEPRCLSRSERLDRVRSVLIVVALALIVTLFVRHASVTPFTPGYT